MNHRRRAAPLLVLAVTFGVWLGASGQAPARAQALQYKIHLPAIVTGAARPVYTGCGGATLPVVNAAYEQQVLDLVNAARAQNARPPLRRSAQLDAAARYHAADMAVDNYFDHNSYDRPGGTLSQVCTWDQRVGGYYTGWQSLRENIAAGQSTPQEVVNGWMNSQGHRENILASDISEIGIGYYATGGTYGRYWVQDFGRRP